MSDLQWSLLGLGIVVILGVVAFNWYQERAHRRRAEEAFEAPPDVLFKDDPVVQDAPPSAAFDDRPEADAPLEPVHAETPAPVPPRPASRSGDAVTKPEVSAVDCEAIFQQEAPFGEEFLQRLSQAIGPLSRAARVTGFDERSSQWVPLDYMAAGRFKRVRAALQLADRQAAATRVELEEFAGAMHGVADDTAVAVLLPDLDAVEARAQELDRFCADVDIAIGLSVVARTGQVFQGTTIRALAEASGLKLGADGQFHYDDAHGTPQFTLDNQDTEPFFPDSIKTLSTAGITFLLDVPRAGGGIASYDRMVQVSKKFASTLDGIIVDDNRQPLSDHGLDAIRRHLLGVYSAMEQAGIPAGSPAALRLFA